MKKRFNATLLLLGLILSLCACGSCSSSGTNNQTTSLNNTATINDSTTANSISVDLSTGPALILPRLESAYNRKDIYAILDCFDPTASKAFFGVAKLFGLEADAFKEILPFMSKALGASDALDDPSWGTVKLTALDYTINGSSGTLKYNVNMTYSSGSTDNFDETIDVELVDSIWYISVIGQNDSSQPASIIPVVDGITKADVADGLYTIWDENWPGKYGFVNISGKTIIEPFFQNVGTFSDGYCPVSLSGRFGFIDLMGNLVAGYQFEDVAAEPSEGFWPVKVNGQWGFINLNTAETIDCVYEDVGCFSEGYAPVEKNGYWGVIDKTGNTIINFVYSEVNKSVKNGLIGVSVNDAWGVVDMIGNYVITLNNDNCSVSIENAGYIIINGESENIKIFDGNGTQLFSDRIIRGCRSLSKDRVILIGECGDIRGGESDGIYWGLPLADYNGSNGCLLVDNNGNILLDLGKTAFDLLSSMGVATTDYYYSFIITAYDNRLIMRIGSYFEKYNTSYINVLDYDGKFLNSWLPGEYGDPILTGEGNVLIYGANGSTAVYRIGDNLIGEIPHDFYSKTASCHNIWTLDENLICSNDYIMNLNDNTINNYIVDSIAKNALVVSDGIFFGVYTEKGLIAQGIKYTEVTYDEDVDILTMELGATSEHYRIGLDGTVNKIS